MSRWNRGRVPVANQRRRKVKSKASYFPALECPQCGKLTKCVDIASDGGAKYRCRNKDAHGWNGGSFSWWIDTNGDFRFGKAYA